MKLVELFWNTTTLIKAELVGASFAFMEQSMGQGTLPRFLPL
jgi:hypothetical protein